ncbi:molybdopterin molybdenumtransferase MoeA [Aureimonas sp. SA4125]|uniref:molybdopterin molybdotransferase MoeA n=1 Tax=Aureimonas sp. SA4125 TaxID=2826993 RepID=UPI001CC40F45|nr:gephyrin-like molybdotransferase Glp [Aureimonas sp. SA4125]BDA84689.1 molybdopterin molybdenumtransferase MoeA [Aureimonas sp. SA4125]
MTLISVEAAFALLMDGAVPVEGTETIGLNTAYGRILASDLAALRTQPSFAASAMDGYALRASDATASGSRLRVVGESAAGRAFGGRPGPGEAVRIFTGAPVPEGCDAIVIQENADRVSDGEVLLLEAAVPGRHIRSAGADFSAGAVLQPAGTRLSAGAIALAASGGYPEVSVRRRPRIAVLATGDELVLPGESIGPSQIVASNSYGVAAMVTSAGGVALDYGIARDDAAEIGGFLDRALAEHVDIFVTIGGASVGDHDLVADVFAQKGVTPDFWKVAMRPGKPLMAGRIGSMRLVGLPGNPASSLVAATLFLRPLVSTLAGCPSAPMYRNAVLGTDMPANDLRADFIRATLGEREALTPVVMPITRQDSSLLSVYARADVLLRREPFASAARAGDPCRYILLD